MKRVSIGIALAVLSGCLGYVGVDQLVLDLSPQLHVVRAPHHQHVAPDALMVLA